MTYPYQGMIAETVTLRVHNNDLGEAYFARPLGKGPFPSVVIIHHMPGWDEWIKEVPRKLAYHGFACIAPHLYFRDGPGDPDDIGARVRAVMGFCSGGRHTYLAACQLPVIHAAVDSWGGNVIADDPSVLNDKRPVAPIGLTAQMRCPLLGIFGNDDPNPSPDQVNRTEAELKKHGKPYEFHRYDGAGHGFFAVDRPGYRAEQATDAWKKVIAFLHKHLDT